MAKQKNDVVVEDQVKSARHTSVGSVGRSGARSLGGAGFLGRHGDGRLCEFSLVWFGFGLLFRTENRLFVDKETGISAIYMRRMLWDVVVVVVDGDG